MQRRNAALFGWILLSLAGCSAGPPPVDLAAEEQAIRAVSMRWLELERARDAAGIAALFAEDGTVFRPGGEPVVGSAAIQAFYAEDFTRNPNQAVEWTTDRVEVAPGGEFAAEYGSWTESGTSDAGTVQDHGRYMTTYRKVGGEWKVVADMSVSTRPQPSAPPATPPGD